MYVNGWTDQVRYEYIKKLKGLLGEEIPEGKDMNVKLEDEDMTEDSLHLPETTRPSLQVQAPSLSPNQINSRLHPMVFQLPETPSLYLSPPPVTHLSQATVLPPVSSFSIRSPTASVKSLKSSEKLPEFISVVAPAWWPQK